VRSRGGPEENQPRRKEVRHKKKLQYIVIIYWSYEAADSSLLYCFKLNKLSNPAAYYRRRGQAFKKILLYTASSLQYKNAS
jgi:hypothetical protein